MNLQQAFEQYWKENFTELRADNCQLILAVSGGMDSVVLTDLVFNAGYNFSIAHCNFQLRGDESERDEGFVRTLGEKYGVQVHIKKFDTLQFAAETKMGIQEAARELRYGWFNELLNPPVSTNYPLSTIHYQLLTAHHADDNAETVLFNIFRGTGMSGLHGILPKQGKIIRPLLFASREMIIAYAKEKALKWVEDSSNESTKYTRNYIRHEVLPLLKQIFPHVTSSINDSIERWREAEMLYEQAVSLHKKKLCEAKGNEVHIPVLKLKRSSPLQTIAYSIIKEYGFTPAQTKDVIGLLDSESGKYVASPSYRIIRNRNWLIITPHATEDADNILIEAGEKKVVFSKGKLLLEETENLIPPANDLIATVNISALQFPLLLRKWKQGDYFYPLGMKKKKKLSRFLIDKKIPIHEKENTWVLESDKRIVWVIGHRIDNRFKILPSTKKALRISLRT